MLTTIIIIGALIGYCIIGIAVDQAVDFLDQRNYINLNLHDDLGETLESSLFNLLLWPFTVCVVIAILIVNQVKSLWE